MFKQITFFILLVIGLQGSLANAGAIINPATGLSGGTSWSGSVGTGFFIPVTSFVGSSDSTADITVGVNSIIDFFIADEFTRGDAFALQLDGFTLAPTSGNLGPDTRGPSATSYFSASFNSIFLSAGAHTFQLFLTDACCSSGATTTAVFSAARASVPAPATLALLGLGLAGLGWSRRKKA